MEDFIIPDFLADYSEEAVYQRMRAMLPADIDSSEGSHVWNFLRPTASVAAELCQFALPQVIMMIFPEWAEGEYLDAHAAERGLTRRGAAAAEGTLTITGTPGTEIPADSRFTTASTDDRPAAEYATTEDAAIDEEGTVSVQAVCTQPGPAGNTAAGTVVLVSGRMAGITGVTNPEPITGGAGEESDETLRDRILEYDRNLNVSFVGSVADYKRWARGSDPRVGSVTVLDDRDGQGTVTILLTNTDGAPASEDLCTAVYNAIMRPDAPEERPAPVNANLIVRAPTPVPIAVQATVELVSGATLSGIKSAFLQALKGYLPTALEEKEVKYTRVAAALSAVSGVNDYSGLVIGAAGGTLGTGNIPLDTDELPTLSSGNLDLTEGTV